MSEIDDESKGKAGRNESRKLLATLANNLGLALIVAAFIQPVLAAANEGRTFGWLNLAVSIAFALLAAILVIVAHLIVRRVDD